jgi:hypothetical protein
MTRIAKMFVLIALLAAVAARPVAAQVAPGILSPRQGDVLQGVVPIRGSSDVTGFTTAEVAFAYAGDTTGTWFLIATTRHPVAMDTLATWDTTTITDGDYNLRLRVYLADGSHSDATIPNLRVRNYTAVETPIPAQITLQPRPVPTDTLAVTPFPSPTALPVNPAVLTPVDISISLAYGGLGAVLLLGILGMYLWLRRK